MAGEAAFWPAPQLRADELLETRWDRELLAPADSGGQRLNAALVRQGEAQVATVPPHMKDQERCLRLQGEAREAKRELWGTK